MINIIGGFVVEPCPGLIPIDDWFQEKGIKPMLIGTEGEAYDSPDRLYELNLDGEQYIAYPDAHGTDLWNKQDLEMLPKIPSV